MIAHRVPRTTEAAQAMLARFAALADEVAGIEAVRNRDIAAANAFADTASEPLLQEQEAIRVKLEPWWTRAGDALTAGKRKSIELGGCMLGTIKGRDTLGIEGDDKAVVAQLKGMRWAKALLRVTTTLDRAAILKSIDGLHKDELAALGLYRNEGEESFFVKRAEQGATLAEVAK